jgi:hypothetical protein
LTAPSFDALPGRHTNQKIDDEELSEKSVSNHVTLLGTMLGVSQQ